MNLSPYLSLARIDKPIGTALLFYPCLWALALLGQGLDFALILYFGIGSFFMRSAGCIINDLVDAPLDAQVKRTKSRTLVSGDITRNQAIWLLILLLSCSLALLIYGIVRLNFPLNTLYWALGGLSLVILYPFMKRITYWPQLFLGITFNWGIFVVGASLDQFPPSLFLLYASGVLWTLGYDTIYGFQDIEDDLKIGIKSTAILSQKYPKLFIGGCYLGSIIMLAAIGLYNQDNFIFLMGTSFFGAMLLKQLYSLNIQNPRECLASFKQGVYIGLIPWIAIILTN